MARRKKDVQGVDSLAYTPDIIHNDRGTKQNLDNGIGALSSVQVSREIIADNGCRVTLNFSSQSRPDIRYEVAKLLIEAFESTRRNENEKASSLPVQSLNEAAG